uniref:Plasmid partition protein putative C-terminal domain-containing protein n=1 Tax=Borrelia garinii subsp. bavariensis (strain ATCC BAA-2496 / DSM 23469 / PBi) TaxID=290434 RepID=A0A7I6GX77_BORGP|nr:hypothetical protein BGP032 [Borreliella bavariensis PBi]
MLSGDLKIEEIKQFGFAEPYKRIKNSTIDRASTKDISIKMLRFKLKNRESYDFYGKNVKFTSYFLDRVFTDKKDLLEEFMKEFESSQG